jgi:hypothetical protein
VRVLICGSRDWEDQDIVWQLLDGLYETSGHELVVIHGAARGADRHAARWCAVGDADATEGPVEMAFPADWDRYGKRAGYVRNAQMLEEGKPDVVYGFMNEPPSKGTSMMLDLAAKAGVSTYRIQRWGA